MINQDHPSPRLLTQARAVTRAPELRAALLLGNFWRGGVRDEPHAGRGAADLPQSSARSARTRHSAR